MIFIKFLKQMKLIKRKNYCLKVVLIFAPLWCDYARFVVDKNHIREIFQIMLFYIFAVNMFRTMHLKKTIQDICP